MTTTARARRVARGAVRRTRRAVVEPMARRADRKEPVKVSIVIATYNSDPAGLERALTSIEKQSMPARDIEVVFVDDGSTDDTPQRLSRWAQRRRKVVIRRIENSGWASRPRNVGVRIARGEYVLFMDHDDELYPHGLEDAYDFGTRHGADIVNGKEARTNGWSWGWDSFAADLPRADPADVASLIPMTPHKLYRRDFVVENDIVFPEERRALWEDIHFNTLALAHGARVAVMAERPFYHWVTTGANTSATFGRDPAELWTRLRGLFELFDSELADRPSRWPMIAHTLRARVLDTVGPKLLDRSPEYLEAVYPRAVDLVARYAPASLDASFSSVHRCRLELLRAGDLDGQQALARIDRDVTARPLLDDAHWEGAELVLSLSTVLVDGEGEPVRVVRDGERWRRDLPAELLAALSPDAVDVTDQLASATFAPSVKGRSSRLTWRLPSTGSVEVGDDGRVTASAVARFDPFAFAAEHGVDDAVWDFAARFEAMGFGAHRGLAGGSTAAALIDGAPAIGYLNQSGLYSLDTDARVHGLTEMALPDAAAASVTAQPAEPEPADGPGGPAGAARTVVEISVPLPGVRAVGRRPDLPGEVLAGGGMTLPATIQRGEGGVVLRCGGTLPDGRHRLTAKFLGRTSRTGLAVVIESGRARVEADVPAAAP